MTSPGRVRPAARWTVVVEVVVVVVLDDEVVVAWQTEMLTVLPLATCVPCAGFWLSTLPGWAPLAQLVSNVVFGTSPAPVMAPCAALADWPMTPGHRDAAAARDDDVDRRVRLDVYAAARVLRGDEPVWNWLEQALVWSPDGEACVGQLRPGRRRGLPEHARHRDLALRARNGEDHRDVLLDLGPSGRRLRNHRPDRLGTGDVLDRVVQALGGDQRNGAVSCCRSRRAR